MLVFLEQDTEKQKERDLGTLFFAFLGQTCLVQMMGRACWMRLQLIAESVCVCAWGFSG